MAPGIIAIVMTWPILRTVMQLNEIRSSDKGTGWGGGKMAG